MSVPGDMRGPGDRALALAAMLISPPFAFILGIIGAVVLWNVLEGADVPAWARLGLSLMAIPAVPGLWFVFMPILFRLPRAIPAGGDEFERWQEARLKVWEEHREAFDALGRQLIERVVASGSASTANDVTITLVAVAFGSEGGDINLILTTTQPTDVQDPAIWDLAADLSDDAGTAYALQPAPIEMSAVGSRAYIAFIPAVPADATELRLTIPKLFRLGETEATVGPWDFSMPLRQT